MRPDPAQQFHLDRLLHVRDLRPIRNAREQIKPMRIRQQHQLAIRIESGFLREWQPEAGRVGRIPLAAKAFCGNSNDRDRVTCEEQRLPNEG